jgi:predicted flap endonuclease-1-like 5' DNA nuclease
MADEDTIKDEGTNKTVAKSIYYVENTVRRVGTRLHRARSATRHRFKIFLGDRRILRNKKLPLTEEQYELFKNKIQEMMVAGKVALHMPDGTRISTLPDGRYVHRRIDGAIKIVEAEGVVTESKSPEPPPKPLPKSVEKALEPEEPIPTPKKPVEPDDLTILPGIGASRVRKLNAAGIVTFADVADAGPAKLVEVLGVAEEVAVEAVEAAKVVE